MKKISCLVVMTTVVFYITACGNKQNGSNNNPDAVSANSGYNFKW
jgi:hypothetical protein